MNFKRSQIYLIGRHVLSIRHLYRVAARRPYTVIMFGALFCTLAVKFFHAYRAGLVDEYLAWVVADISFLLGLEVIIALICFRWPRRWLLRLGTIVAALICTWSVMNAGWLIRTGTQILPRVLLPILRAPLNTLAIVGVNLVKMPKAAAVLLVPSAMGLAFFFSVLARPLPPHYNRKRFIMRVLICIIVISVCVLMRPAAVQRSSREAGSIGMRYNSHLRAVVSLLLSDYKQPLNPQRQIPSFDQVQIKLKPQHIKHNLVIVILEGIQYRYTSLADELGNLTPYLASFAEQGVEFANARSSLSHTTKALFAFLTGRFPSTSQDIAEAVPAVKPYASIATILNNTLNYRTAFFQSAKGDFECRPGLVYNLGFNKFWARDDLNDPNSFLGYLACDEFSMLKPIADWIKQDECPFFLTILCSVTHDPYEVPSWFAEPAKEPTDRYRQAIFYTDKFLAALDVELANLNVTDKTILCIVGDHGEAFGEHGPLGHALIAFDEVLRIPFCVRAPFLVQLATKVPEPVSSVDLAPTLLALLGFETEAVGFDGVNALGRIPSGRKLYFSDWMQEGPAGFVKGSQKFVYSPANKAVWAYDLSTDPLELARVELGEEQARRVADEIIAWRRDNVFKIDQQRRGRETLFGRWLCEWTNRISRAKYDKKNGE